MVAPIAAADPPGYGADLDGFAGGMSIVWEVDGAFNASPVLVRSTTSFSADNRLLGVLEEDRLKIVLADAPGEMRAVPTASGHRAFSVAVAPDGRVAIGRVGGVHVHEPNGRRSVWYACHDACGPVLALAFSPDGRQLAYQGARALDDRRRGYGSVVVLDARNGAVIADLPAAAARAFVEFSSNGGELVASNVTALDDVERHGVRVWDTADWALRAQLPGSVRQWRALGRVAGRPTGVYVDAENVELRRLDDDSLIWSTPLVRPSLDYEGQVDAPTMRLELVALAPNGEFAVGYESPAANDSDMPGTIVIRDTRDGSVAAMYDVADVTGLAISPNNLTFVYSTGAGRMRRVLARVPSGEPDSAR